MSTWWSCDKYYAETEGQHTAPASSYPSRNQRPHLAASPILQQDVIAICMSVSGRQFSSTSDLRPPNSKKNSDALTLAPTGSASLNSTRTCSTRTLVAGLSRWPGLARRRRQLRAHARHVSGWVELGGAVGGALLKKSLTKISVEIGFLPLTPARQQRSQPRHSRRRHSRHQQDLSHVRALLKILLYIAWHARNYSAIAAYKIESLALQLTLFLLC
jgi:hypothetical protein